MQTTMKLFKPNPFKKGIQAYRVYEIFVEVGGRLMNWDLHDRARAVGILNPRARVSDIRDAGIRIDFNKKTGHYEMEQVA